MVLVYVTTKDIDEAKKIGRVLVEERLAACVNLLPQMHSIYWWQDKVDTSDECVLLAKTEERLVDKLASRIKALHSYEVPCIMTAPVNWVEQNYLRWLQSNVAKTGA